MGDSPHENGKTGSDLGKKKLSPKRTLDSGHVKQNFGGGRSKSVLVETRKKKVVTPTARPSIGGKIQLGTKKISLGGAKTPAPVVAKETAAPSETPPPPAAEPTAEPSVSEEVAPIEEIKETVTPKVEAKPTPAPVVKKERAAPVAKKPVVAKRPVPPKPDLKGKPPRRKGRPGAKADKGKDNLSNSEMDARLKALALAKERAQSVAKADSLRKEEEARRAAEEAKQRADKVDAQEKEVKEEVAKKVAADQLAKEEKAKKEADEIRAAKKKKISAKAEKPQNPNPIPDDIEVSQKDKTIRIRTVEKRKEEVKPAPKKKVRQPRLKNKLTINNFDNRGRERSLASIRRHQQKQQNRIKMQQAGGRAQKEKVNREVIIPDSITIQELSNRMTERSVDVVKFLMKQGEMLQASDFIDTELAELVVEEFGHVVRRVSEADIEIDFWGEDDDDENLIHRAPVVTIMGHVDHGKTSLLDAIRETKVTEGESGGITQHIGAYQVSTNKGDDITFIDTPGHAAFTEMRSRGAKVTDIVVLVVAADDGVMPQTIEAIHHAKAAEVPIIVAINKIDLPSADANKIRADLLRHELVVEGMGGDIQDVEVSAKTGQNLEGLLEAIILQTEVLELTANPKRSAEGFVIEAKLEAGRGTVSTVLVQRGTLNIGNVIVAGKAWGRVRALVDDLGRNMKDAGPSMPVEVLGMDKPPFAGDQFAVVENEAKAREITEYRARKERSTAAEAGRMTSLEQMMNQLEAEKLKTFPIILKGDVQGSVEAIKVALENLGNEEVSARIIHSGAGGINESDINLAHASGAIVMAFNVRANRQAQAAAEADGIEIRYYSVIYDLIDDVKMAMSGMLDPTLKENYLGHARIQEVFDISKVGKIAGCKVTEGRVERGANVRLIRDDIVIHEGELSTLKRFKDEVKEVLNGQECGMAFKNFEDLREDDIIEAFTIEHVARSL